MICEMCGTEEKSENGRQCTHCGKWYCVDCIRDHEAWHKHPEDSTDLEYSNHKRDRQVESMAITSLLLVVCIGITLFMLLWWL